MKKLCSLGITSGIVGISETRHPFWHFHPWFEPTLAATDRFPRAQLTGKM